MGDCDYFRKPGEHISSLFPEVLAMIFCYLDVKDKGRVSQVCRKWRNAAYNRMVWKGIEAKLHLKRSNPSLFSSLVRRGIKRVQVLSIRKSLRDIVTGIPDLESLNLSGCYNVTDMALSQAFIHELPNLRVLNLSLCKQVTDTSLERIAQCLTNIEILELGGCCNVTNNGLYVVACALKKIKTLNLRSCRHISDQGVGYISGAVFDSNISEKKRLPIQQGEGNSMLEYLGLQDCQKLTDEALKHLSTGLSNLKSINLSFCGSVTDSGLKFISKMTSLRELNLRSCDNVSDIGLGYLSEGGSQIACLDVSFCDKIGDQGLLFLSHGLFSLRNLSLSACSVSDDGICRLVCSLHEINTLNIGQCTRITDKSLTQIGENLKNLESIDLYGCTKITTVGLEKIMQLPKLSTLNLGLWHRN